MAPALQDMQAFLQLLRQKVETQELNKDKGPETNQEPEQMDPSWQQPVLEERSVTYSTGDTYKGFMLGNQRHGQGVHSTTTGDVYEGSWSYDQRSGTGKFTMSDGTCYEGEWEDDKAHGMGKCRYRDGSVYDGEWRADDRWGWGTLVTADGQQYEGEWEHNQPHGQGRWVLADGLSYYEGSYSAGRREQGRLVLYDSKTKKPATSYTGSFKNNLKHGEGVMVCEGTWIYQGAWHEDRRCGRGSCKYISGDEYVGEWKDDMKHGSGVLKLVSGGCYDGQWLEDTRHGVGKMRLATGEHYIGQWKHGKRHGQGKWTSALKALPNTAAAAAGESTAAAAAEEARETYFGHWMNDKREGQGVAAFADGGRYQGSWKADKRHGEGVMMFPDGVIFRGMWENDEWIQSAADPTLCRITGPGISRALAGQKAGFKITAKDENDNPRLSGGDTFRVLLVPGRKATGPAVEIMSQQQQQEQQQQQVPVSALQACNTDESSSSTNNSNSGYIIEGSAQPPLQQQQQQQQQQPPGDDSSLRLTEVVTAVAEGEVQDNGDGSYSCSYTYTKAGQFELHITNGDGEHVADSPYPVRILPGSPSARHCTVTGPGKTVAVAGAVAEFEVTVRDAHGNEYATTSNSSSGGGSSSSKWREELGISELLEQLPLQAELLGSNTLPVSTVEIVAQPGGRYSCSYTAPAAAGLYVLQVTSAGKHLRGSPFSVKVTPAPQAAGEGTSAATAGTAAADSSSSTSSRPFKQQALEDKVTWWAQVAKEAYAAVDGSLEGYEQQQSPAAVEGNTSGLSGQEADMVKANPQLPVVERLEDLWLLSKLQQERKAKEQTAMRDKARKQLQQEQNVKEQLQSKTNCKMVGKQEMAHQAKAVQHSQPDQQGVVASQVVVPQAVLQKQQQAMQQRQLGEQDGLSGMMADTKIAVAQQQQHGGDKQDRNQQKKDQQWQQQQHGPSSDVLGASSSSTSSSSTSSSSGCTDADQTESVGEAVVLQPSTAAAAAASVEVDQAESVGEAAALQRWAPPATTAAVDGPTLVCQDSSSVERSSSVDAAVQVLLPGSNSRPPASYLQGKPTGIAEKSLLYELD